MSRFADYSEIYNDRDGEIYEYESNKKHIDRLIASHKKLVPNSDWKAFFIEGNLNPAEDVQRFNKEKCKNHCEKILIDPNATSIIISTVKLIANCDYDINTAIESIEWKHYLPLAQRTKMISIAKTIQSQCYETVHVPEERCEGMWKIITEMPLKSVDKVNCEDTDDDRIYNSIN